MQDDKRGGHTTAIHAGIEPEEHRGAVSVPIYQSSTFAFPNVEEGAARFAGQSKGLIYTRMGNPTVQALEQAVAELEGGVGAVATATGMAAISTVLLALVREGDHVIVTRPLYGATGRLIADRLSRFGIMSTFVQATDARAIARALCPETRLIFIETPANPTLDLVDIAAAARIAQSAGINLAVDNTFAGPHLQRPLELGATIVVHSTTKSLNGHSDVVAGAIATNDAAVLKAI